MAIDRAGARRRVRIITAFAAAGAAALTAGFAMGAARGDHVAAHATASSPTAERDDAQPVLPQSDQGFQPPSSSTGTPQGMSGGS